MKREYAARARLGIGVVAEQNLGIGGDVFETALFWVDAEPLGRFADVTRGLVRVAAERGPGRLGLDDAAKFLVDEQGVVGRS
ncbi:MAG: hypothetical protein WD039_01945, partial [Xanthobacteraceae bacterium]